MRENFLYVNLQIAGLTLGKPFEAFTHGLFTDMRGRAVKISPSELDEIVTNTKALIETTANNEGELAGLPIDSKGHDHGDAAGWIVGIELAGDVVRLIPKWTELGIEKISKGIQKLFSITLDPIKNVIVGGSLTNWPAVKGLKPIELEQAPGLFTLELSELDSGESLGERIQRVRAAFRKSFQSSPDMPYAFVPDVHLDYAIIETDSEKFRVGYTIDTGGDVDFEEREEWKRIRMVPKEFSEESFLDRLTNRIREAFSPKGLKAEAETLETQDLETEEEEMNKEQLEQLKAEIRGELLRELAGPLGEGATDVDALSAQIVDKLKMPDVAGAVDLESARSALMVTMKTALEAEYSRMQAQAGQILATMVEEIRVNSDIVEFSDKVTGGEMGLALPMDRDRIETFLKALDPNQRKEAMAIFGDTVRSGLVPYDEVGSGKDGVRLLELPEQLTIRLNSGDLKVEDLGDPIVAPLLGGHKPEEYDLSAWKEKADEEEEK